MCGFESAETTVLHEAGVAPEVPIEISSDDARQGETAVNTLHVLGFGLAGAVLGNAIVLLFVSWASMVPLHLVARIVCAALHRWDQNAPRAQYARAFWIGSPQEEQLKRALMRNQCRCKARNKTSPPSISCTEGDFQRQSTKETTMSIKTQIVLSVAIALGSASAAFAYAPSKHDRFMFDSTAAARAMVRSKQVRHSSNPGFDVYDNSGHYVGSDPDPFIRSQLARDPHPEDWTDPTRRTSGRPVSRPLAFYGSHIAPRMDLVSRRNAGNKTSASSI
jgi:hypothetical protein